MVRSSEDQPLDYRSRLVALVAALDQSVSVSRLQVEVDQAWLDLLIELAGDVHDLREANTCIDSIDLRDVCKEIYSLVLDLDVNAGPGHDGNVVVQRTVLRYAQADCMRIVRDLCSAGNGSAVNDSSNSTGAN